MNSCTGIAILKITKEDSEWVPFCVDVEHIETEDEYEPLEEFDLLETDTLSCPDVAYDLEVGESVRVRVGYSFLYTKDYFGEVDCDLEYTSQLVLAL